MKVEYIIDESGNQKSVLIDINDWKKFNQKYKELQNKLKILNSLEKAVDEVQKLKSGKRPKKSMKNLLNEI